MNRSEGQWVQPELSANVYRGTNRINSNNVGSHFSADKSVAHYFKGRGGVIINAEVPVSSMETNTQTLRGKGVLEGPNRDSETAPYDEKEVTVKTGAPIKVKSVSKFGPQINTKSIKEVRDRYRPNRSVDYMNEEEAEQNADDARRMHRVRTRTYKKGKEMKA